MSCLTTGRNRTCGNGTTGGAKWLYLADREVIDITATEATQAVDGSFPSVTMIAPLTDFFYKFVGKRNTINVNESLTNDNGNSSNVTTITIVFGNSTQADKNIIDELKKCVCGLVAIWCDNSGNTKITSLIDSEELLLATGVRDTGTAKADPNQTTLTFTAETACFADEYTGGEGSIPVAP
jgi:hypothetical protein